MNDVVLPAIDPAPTHHGWIAGWRRLRQRSARVRLGPGLGLLSVAASVLAATLVLAHWYGVHDVVSAVRHANVWLLGVVVGLGVVNQVIRARRAQVMLAADGQVRFAPTYGAMVVGHGIGDLVPLVPGGPLLRSVLTERLTAIPIAYSAGVYILEGILDGVGPALLMVYLLLALALPGWTRMLLLAALGQSLFLLVVPALLGLTSRAPRLHRLATGRLATLARLGHQILDGFLALQARGWRVMASVISLSLLVTLVAAVQLALFLLAFGLGTSLSDLVLVLVMNLTAGSLPIKIPGSGTLAAGAVLALAGIHGAGLGGYVLVSRLVFSSLTVVLAVLTLGWWTVTKNRCFRELGELFHLSRAPLLPEEPLAARDRVKMVQ